MIFLLLLAIAIAIVTYATTAAAAYDGLVAIGVQGTADGLQGWLDLYHNKAYFAVKEHTHLFVLSFDHPVPVCEKHSDVHCVFAKNTTWTQGRNLLARAMHAYERERGGTFRYWLFADADMAKVGCKAAEAAGLRAPSDAAALCMSRHILYYLLSRLSYASVFFLGALGGEMEHYHFDCGDAQLHAIHRAAAPVLLPLVERLDALSWQESQVVLWRVAAGCLANSGAGAGVLSMQKHDEQHSPYPGGSYTRARAYVISDLYGRQHGLSPHPIDNSTFNTVQGDCASQDNQVKERRSRPDLDRLQRRDRSEAAVADPLLPPIAQLLDHWRRGEDAVQPPDPEFPPDAVVAASRAWRNSSVYHLCLKRLRHRFERFMAGALLTHIDGGAVLPGEYAET